jgi:hypothetical protein
VSGVEQTARELYGLAPDDFTAARNGLAKGARAAGDTDLADDIQKLRKPTTAAWVLNSLVRQHRDEVDQVLALGAELRAAQGVLAGDELRALDRSRRQLTHAVTEQARALARESGHPVSAQVAGAVEESLRAAMADAGAAAALSTGLLTDAFTSTGLDPVDLHGLVAVPSALPDAEADAGSPRGAKRPRTPAPHAAPDPAELADARAAVGEADRELEESRGVTEQAKRTTKAARREREALEAHRSELRQQLEELELAVTEAEEAERTADRLLRAAERDEAAATMTAERARRRLDALG